MSNIKTIMTEEEFLLELKKKLPYPDEISDTELEIALSDFHNGLDIESVANHLIYGEAFLEDLY